MSLSKTFLLAGAAALVSSAALASHSVPMRASDVVGFHGVKAPVQSLHVPKKGKCGTVFGNEPTTPNGIIAWNDTSGTGFNNQGGADFTCTKSSVIHKVWVYGYDAPHNPELYNVTIYANDSDNDGFPEPDDNNVLCSYSSLSGAGGGSYPTRVLTKLKLNPTCKLGAGQYWVAVQDFDASGPWYWEVTSTLQGTQADWVDYNNSFGSGCTTFDNSEYLVNCLGYTYPDWMLVLH